MAQQQYDNTPIAMQTARPQNNNNNSHHSRLLANERSANNQPHGKFHQYYKNLVIVLSVMLFATICICIVLAVHVTKQSTSSSSSSDSKLDNGTPKNLIVMIGDGMGTSYNAAYRIYKNRSSNLIDEHFQGRYSTHPSNSYPYGITDSAAGAVAFASGIVTQNAFLGVDSNMNPVGSILAASKRRGKGTGIVSTKSVTDATPAAFNAHTVWRRWNELIAEQQATRQLNGAPLTDVIFGGGRRYFNTLSNGSAFWHDKSVWHGEYKWSRLLDTAAEFDNLSVADLPAIGLFSSNHFPYYLDRLNGANSSIPDLRSMSEKAVALLDEKYSAEGFFLMIEGSKIDSCGHDNDIVCMLWEMEEFEKALEFVLDFAEQDGDTLVVVLADHETGGLSIGRDASLLQEAVVDYEQGTMPRDWQQGGISAAWGNYLYSMEIAPPQSVRATQENVPLYKWYPYPVQFSKHTAEWIEHAVDEMVQENGANNATLQAAFALIEENYVGALYPLSEQEKEYINRTWLNEPSENGRELKYAPLMNARTLTGWTTHGHTGADISLYAYGPSQNRFRAHFRNYQIGQMLSEIFDVQQEQTQETQWLLQQFDSGVFPKLCDDTVKPPYVEWNASIPYPPQNVRSGQYCVQQWAS